MNKEQLARPFLKWAGGKTQLLTEIKNFYPNELGKKINKYCEPMVGAGAVFFDILNNYNLEEIYINDINKELINCYSTIKNNVDLLIEKLEKIESKHFNLEDADKKNYYYKNRNTYNEIITMSNKKNSIERASLFIYLNKTCFNGLYRVNKKGLYNVPMGTYKKPVICDKNNLMIVSEKLKNVKIHTGEYFNMKKYIDHNTFVYFDPPYRPLTKTSEFTSYNSYVFDDEEQKKLSCFIKSLSKNGVNILASNSDPKNIDENDNFFDELYKPFDIVRVNAKRCINSKGNKRGNITEILIKNY